MDRNVIEKKLKDLEARAAKVSKQKTEIEKTLAVKENQYEQALERLKKLGIDASKMKGKDLEKLRAEEEAALEAEMEKLEASVAESEVIISEFQEAMG